jgi:hypothetical protein
MISLRFPNDFVGFFMISSRFANDLCMVSQCFHHGFLMLSSWFPQISSDLLLISLWFVCVFLMNSPWFPHGIFMILPWFPHAFLMISSNVLMIFLWFAVCSSWFPYDFLVISLNFLLVSSWFANDLFMFS